MGAGLLDSAETFLPRFLNAEDRSALLRQLIEFPEGYLPYIDGLEEHDLLQGDVWEGFSVLEAAGEQIAPGIIVSNSCDIDLANDKGEQRRVLFAPLIPVAAFEKLLLESGHAADAVQEKIRQIRLQEVHRIFYLPQRGDFAERLVFLDNIRPQTLSEFLRSRGTRLVRLSQMGHYLFLIKLSIHFTRLGEGVKRS